MTLSIEEVLSYLNNYFIETCITSLYVAFDAETKKISLAAEGETFEGIGVGLQANQYIKIEGSKLNDGVYKINSINTNYVVVEETLIDETAGYINLYELAIPKALISIIAEMQSWTGTENVKSESLGPHSITYDRPVNVYNQFNSRLKKYKKVGWR